MSNLTPEKRQDKNGRMVTRHVKTGTAAPGAGRIPQPLIDQRDPAEDKKLVDFASPKNAEKFLEQVQTARPELVRMLNDFYERHGKSYLTREVADHTIAIVKAARSVKHIHRYVENLMTHFDFMRTLDHGDHEGIMLINGLIDVEYRVTGPLSERQQQAVMRVTRAMMFGNKFVDPLTDVEMRLRHDMYHFVITDQELVRMVADRPENDTFIAAAVSAGTLHPGQIKTALDDNIQQPLLGGAL